MEIIALSSLVDALLAGLLWYILYQRRKKETTTSLLHTLQNYLLFFCGALFLTALTGALSYFFAQSYPHVLEALKIFTQLLFFVALAYLGRIAAALLLRRRGTAEFYLLLLLGVLASVASGAALYAPEFFEGSGALELIAAMSSSLFEVLLFGVWLLAGLSFLVEGLTAQLVTVRLRNLFFALSLILISFSFALRLYIHNVQPDALFLAIATSSLLSFIALYAASRKEYQL